MNIVDYVKIRNFCSSKTPLREWNASQRVGEHICDPKTNIHIIYDNMKKTDIPIKKQTKALNRHSTEDIPTANFKQVFALISHQGSTTGNSKDLPTPFKHPEWFKWKRQTTSSVGRMMQSNWNSPAYLVREQTTTLENQQHLNMTIGTPSSSAPEAVHALYTKNFTRKHRGTIRNIMVNNQKEPKGPFPEWWTE